MRVALVGSGVYPIPPNGYGGIERYLDELRWALTAAGHEVTIVDIPSNPNGWRGHEAELRSVARGGGFDVVHAHTNRAATALGFGLVPYVYTTHTVWWFRKKTLRESVIWERERMAVRLAHAAVVETRRMRDLVGKVPLRRGSLTIIPHGVDAEKFRERGAGDPYRALGVGIVDRRKRWHLAARAVEGTKVRLRVVGPIVDPTYADEIRGLGAEVVGEVSDAELLRELDACGLLLHPSEAETFGVTVIQAMAFSRPVIGTQVLSEIPGLLLARASDEATIVREMREFVLALSENESTRLEAGRTNRATVERLFAYPVVVRDHIEVYRSVAARSRPGRR